MSSLDFTQHITTLPVFGALYLTALDHICPGVHNPIGSGNKIKKKTDRHQLYMKFISTGKETKQRKLYCVEYFNIMCFYEVPLESSLYYNHSEMDQHRAFHLLQLLKIRGERKGKYGGWLMGTLCGGETGFSVWVTVVSTCNFCAVHLENTHWVLPYGFSVQFMFCTLSASSC